MTRSANFLIKTINEAVDVNPFEYWNNVWCQRAILWNPTHL